MEETKELQTMYKIFRCLIYLSLIVEFFEYAIDPALLDYWGGIVCDIHSRVKRWFIYLDGNLVWSKLATIVLICITCIGTRNKKHLEFDARRQVFYPLVAGVLQFHKKGDALYLNLSASGVNTFNAGSQDAITGTIEFRGTIGKQVDVKTDKKGKPYTLFSAYSSEKDGDNYAYTWIRFMQFDTTKADWVQAKAGINAKGDLQVGAYNDRLDLTCRITELTPWEKKAASTNQ